MRRLRASAALRSVLALLLVCAQVFAAVHAVGHVAEWSAGRGPAPFAAPSPDAGAASGEAGYGGLPAAERHERCLLCLTAADLAAALPPALPVLAVDTLPAIRPGAVVVAPSVRRLPHPPGRGPPSSV